MASQQAGPRRRRQRKLTGAALVARIRADLDAEGLVPDSREEELLTIAAALQDRIVELEETIAADGISHTSDGGIVRLHPAVAEARQTRTALVRTLAGIAMTDDGKNAVKQKAAQTRWRAHNQAKGRIG